jgi:histidinol-phosphate/aromatic aminotransferase/cobyric acid decarboxylase-like protein
LQKLVDDGLLVCGPHDRCFSLRRARQDVDEELTQASRSVSLTPSGAFLEAFGDGYYVNGDSIESGAGRYPSSSALLDLEQRLATIDNVQTGSVVVIGGGIACALDLTLRAYQLSDHEVLVIGPLYGGASDVLELQGLRRRALPLDGLRSYSSCLRKARCVFVTHPTLYLGRDLGDTLHWLEE